MTDTRLTDLIAEVVKEKTFSMDGLQAIEQIRQKAITTEKDLNHANGVIRDLNAQVSKLQHELQAFKDRAQVVTAADAAVKLREAKITELERDTAVAKAESRVLDKVVSGMLANRIIRESIHSSVPAFEPYGGGGGTWSTRTRSDETVTEHK